MSPERILGIPFFTGPVEEAVAETWRGGLVVAPLGPDLANELRMVDIAGVLCFGIVTMTAGYRLATPQPLI
jgi:hypothetical protein